MDFARRGRLVGRYLGNEAQWSAWIASKATGAPAMRSCGDGYMLALLAHRFPAAQLIGIDMSPEELELARRARRR